MSILKEPEETLLSIKYRPDGETTLENPPRFTWMPEGEDSREKTYFLEISKNSDFSESYKIENIPYNFYTPKCIFEPELYYWRYGISGCKEYSTARTVVVRRDAELTPLPGREERYRTVNKKHPRIWMNSEQIESFSESLKQDSDYCGFNTFLHNSVEWCEKQGFPKEPLPYPENKRIISMWRQNYTDCQMALRYIRSLAVAGNILKCAKWKEMAKKALLELASWDVNGTTSRDYNDECAFRVVYGLAFGYDWLYEMLDFQERKVVEEALYQRIYQVAYHVIVDSRIHLSLYDSHAVRSLASVLTPCCIALLDEPLIDKRAQKIRDWLDYGIEYFSTIYTPWGGNDGGWAEGPKYWESGMAFVIDAINTIRNYIGIDFYKRPFFKKTGDFLLYCNPVDTRRASFCDQSNLGKYPGHKAACNIRQFGGVYQKPEYQWYYNSVFAREPEIDNDFFNAGWWDFAYDDMVYRHDYEKENKELLKEKPLQFEKVKWFCDIGWVSINTQMEDSGKHIFFLTKSSPYGSISHSHGDQNGILLHAYGEPLLIESGYYVGFNSSMHRDWRRQTRSTNNILIDTMGQYAGFDKDLQLKASGKIKTVCQEKNYVYICEEAVKAYQNQVPDVRQVTREIYFVDDIYFVIVDTVKTDVSRELSFLLHGLSPFEFAGNCFCLKRPKAELEGQFVYVSSGIKAMEQKNRFEGVKEEETVGNEPQWHMTMKTGKAKNHRIITLLVPSGIQEKERVEVMINMENGKQGIVFNHKGKTFSVVN